jgi:hypothetical protein
MTKVKSEAKSAHNASFAGASRMQAYFPDEYAAAEKSREVDLEGFIKEDFERCYPGETLDDFKRRASFSRWDKGVLREWMALAALRASASRPLSTRQSQGES